MESCILLHVVDADELVEVRDESEGQVVEVARVDGDVDGGAADLEHPGGGIAWEEQWGN